MIEPYRPLYTVKEAAKILMVNADSVYDLVRRRKLPALRLGSMKIRGSDLERFIEKYPAEGQWSKEDAPCANTTTHP